MIRNTLTLLLFLIMITGCHSIPKHYEDENVYVVDHKVYIRHSDKLTEQQYQEVVDTYTKPYMDDNEKKALKHRRIADGADVVTTLIGMNLGCREVNPLVGSKPGLPILLVVKGAGYWMTYSHAKASPKAFSSAKKLKNDNYILFGVVTWNLYQLSQGCIG